eukprot:NODE_595_length_5602_cov_0.719062.p2 type:complete len:230 gc:universal NODE_595_length_5602_cov_0.719062:2046-2735(+)
MFFTLLAFSSLVDLANPLLREKILLKLRLNSVNLLLMQYDTGDSQESQPMQNIERYYRKLFESASRDEYIQSKIINYEAAWPVNSLVYWADYVQKRSENHFDGYLRYKIDRRDICNSVIYSFDHLDAQFTQKRVYFTVMLNIYEYIREYNPKRIPELLRDFVMVFFFQRPNSRTAQESAIRLLASKYEKPEIGEDAIQNLPSRFDDPFYHYFQLKSVRKCYPQAVLHVK